MSYKVIKEWLFAGLRRSRSKHGVLCVSNQGEAIIVVRFYPEVVVVQFQDKEPPQDPCNPHDPDQLAFETVWLGFGRYGVKIRWDVWSVRRIKYQIEGTAP